MLYYLKKKLLLHEVTQNHVIIQIRMKASMQTVQTGTRLLDQCCSALPRSLHSNSHLSDTVQVNVTKLKKKERT